MEELWSCAVLPQKLFAFFLKNNFFSFQNYIILSRVASQIMVRKHGSRSRVSKAYASTLVGALPTVLYLHTGQFGTPAAVQP